MKELRLNLRSEAVWKFKKETGFSLPEPPKNGIIILRRTEAWWKKFLLELEKEKS